MCIALSLAAQTSPILDQIQFGHPASEQAHELVPTASEVIDGALGQSARQLLPLTPASWDGGKVAFDLKVDPKVTTYITVKLWGSDHGLDRGRLLLFANGKQVGQRHLGDVDILDVMSDEPRYPGRFVYKTLPLPQSMTQGKTDIQLEIRALGRIWGYGNTWERFQKVLEKPSRGIYGAYTHTDTCFNPPSSEVQGVAPTRKVRKTPGVEVLQVAKERVNKDMISRLAEKNRNMGQMNMVMIAKAYHTPWTAAYHKPEVIERLAKELDHQYVKYKANPRDAEYAKDTWNPDWFGYGPNGQTVMLLAEQFKPILDEKIEGADGISRRAGWSEMLVYSRDWHIRHRRQYTNQAMIIDLYTYLANRGVRVLTPDKAWDEPTALRYLYGAVGIEPWLGSVTDNGLQKPLGDNYMQLTEKGLTKELGYVGNYGEVVDWVAHIYDATRPAIDQPGDPKILAQLVKITKARAVFRYPGVDADGNHAMFLETPVGWRDSHYPGYIVYGQRDSRDGSSLQAAALTLDPQLIGYAQQMFEDNQFYASLKHKMGERMVRVTCGLLETPGELELLKAQPDQPYRLPMAKGQPDFVFSDEEDGVVAIKNGDEIFYASLYWRARYAVNFLARVHYMTPTLERDATVTQDVIFDDSGMVYKRRDHTIEPHSGRHERKAKQLGLYNALAGEEQPIAKLPDDVLKNFKPGKENIFAGKGQFYTLRYGPYVIAMNMTTNKTFDLTVPQHTGIIKELVNKTTAKPNDTLNIKPRSTVVLYLQ
tara:strand:- start:59796 stop:62084 length:2289 start_codon:yes stop_codon:yes gene_type:complete